MSVTIMCGWEQGSAHEAHTVTTSGTGTCATQTTTKHTGTYALQCTANSTSTAYVEFRSIAAGGTRRTIGKAIRFWLNVATLGVTFNALIIDFESNNGAASGGELRLTPSGQLQVFPVGGSSATSSLTLSTATWYCVEFEVGWSSGQGARVYVNGNEWASTTSGSGLAAIDLVRVGLISSGTTYDLYVDDIVLDDAVFSELWGSYSMVALRPVSDNNRGNWTGGAGGTSNLFDAINNQPPAGLTAGSDTNTSQIQNATSATYPTTAAQLGQFDCTDYATAGLVASDIIRAVQAVCNHAEGIATGTKPGGVFIVSNPAQGTLGDWFDYGNDVGAMGTWPFTTAGSPTRGWFTAWATGVGYPSVTLGTKPVIGVFKNNSTTRETHVAFAAIYVAYSAGLSRELQRRPYGLSGQNQQHQLLAY